MVFIRSIAGLNLELEVGARYRAEPTEVFGQFGVRIHRWNRRSRDWERFPAARLDELTPDRADAFVTEFNGTNGLLGRIWPVKEEADEIIRRLSAGDPPALVSDDSSSRKTTAVQKLASLCARYRLDTDSVFRRMGRPDQYDFDTERGLVQFAMDAGAAVQFALVKARAGRRQGAGERRNLAPPPMNQHQAA